MSTEYVIERQKPGEKHWSVARRFPGAWTLNEAKTMFVKVNAPYHRRFGSKYRLVRDGKVLATIG